MPYKNYKETLLKNKLNYYKNIAYSILKSIKQRCHNPNCKDFKWYGGRGIKCLITEEEIKELMIRDGYWNMKKPSIDRKNNDGNYTFDNCQFIELKCNCGKELRKPILQFDLQGNFIREWESIQEAGRQLNISPIQICYCCKYKKRFKTAGGSVWRYKNESS